MSTKIYTGFLVKHGDPARLMKDLKALQIEYTKRAKSYASAMLPYGNLLDNEEAHRETIKHEYEEMLMADVVIYFVKDKILGTYFIHDRILEAEFRKQDWFTDWHYQNQADKPEEIKDEEWAEREKDWEFLNVPADDGFLFQLVNPKNIQPIWISLWRRDQKEKETNK